MLTKLKISNFVLIDKLDLDFKSGLTVLTGETGSGKSIIIDALMLIFGARVTIDIIRHGTDTADLVAEFELSNLEAINWLQDNDLANTDDESQLICRRVIDRNGKNKIYINGHTVTSTQAKILNELILDIHTQHAAITLLKQDSQRLLIDEYAGISDKVVNLNTLYKKISQLKANIHELTTNSQKALELKYALEEQFQELQSLNLKPGEWTELENRHKQISNLSVVLNELDNIQNIVGNSEFSLIQGINSLNNSIKKIYEYLPQAESLAKIVDSLKIEINELNHDINTITKSIDVEPGELQTLEERIEQIFTISRKYRIDPSNIVEHLNDLQQQLNTIEHNSNLEVLEKELASVLEKYSKIAAEITKSRTKASNEISNAATKLLHTLAINGEFKATLIPNENLTNYGLENIEFNIAFNKGMPLSSLAKVASGGELSRTALALYLLLSLKNSPETIIFDEIDVGIGGGIASHIGKMLNQLGHNKQVLCITHQAQTASFGNNHLVVSKNHAIDTDLTTLNATYLTPEARIQEIARMIGGVKITDTTINHAREMLEHGAN